MNIVELHDILDDENKKISKEELKQIIYELKQDTYNEMCKYDEEADKARYTIDDMKHRQLSKYYSGETNAFQLCLDLMSHLE